MMSGRRHDGHMNESSSTTITDVDASLLRRSSPEFFEDEGIHGVDPCTVSSSVWRAVRVLVRVALHLVTVVVALLGSLLTLLGFAAADAAERGAGFFGCGDGIPDPQGAADTRSWTLLVALGTVGIIVAVQAGLAATRRPSNC